MKSIALNSLVLIFLFTTTSCENWLNVNMDDRIMESTLYSTNSGYMKALNGIYIKMNSVYGPDLTCGIIDVMAQYYNVTENDNHSYKDYKSYRYGNESLESKNGSIWGAMYETIANINVLLKHCDETDAAIRADYYPIIKGEALALRAMLHFDLLRLYGPIPDASNSGVKCIPYIDSESREIFPYLSAGEVIEKVIKDLNDAAGLLRDTDPIVIEGVITEIPEDDGTSANDMSYRQLRLNYYAVQGLLARVNLWKGDKDEAYRIARHEVIDKAMKENGKGIFSWATQESYSATNKEDFMFSSEVMFALYNSKRIDIYNQLFAKSLMARSSRLTFTGFTLGEDSKVAVLYDDVNDWRRNMWKVAEPTQAELQDAEEHGYEAKGSLYLDKFKDFESGANVDGSEIYRYMLPLVRLSEMYLIAAECTGDQEEARQLINELRTHRNCRSLTGSIDVEDVITKEFAKEMIGEGQLFFYYKRLGKEVMISGTSTEEDYNMILSNYVWPLPKAETDKRVELNQ